MTDKQPFLNELADRAVAHGTPGVIQAVSRGKDLDVAVAGVARADGTAMARDSIVRIASITKPIVAAAVMTLVEDGTLALDAPVDDWLPELAHPSVLRHLDGPVDDVVPAQRPITVEDLLTFRAGHGFPDDFSAPVVQLLFQELRQGPPHPPTVPAPDEWMRRLAGIPLLHQPGQGWTYNTGSDILGVLLETSATG